MKSYSRVKRNYNTKQKFSIRKISTVGAASALIGSVVFLAPTVKADESISTSNVVASDSQTSPIAENVTEGEEVSLSASATPEVTESTSTADSVSEDTVTNNEESVNLTSTTSTTTTAYSATSEDTSTSGLSDQALAIAKEAGLDISSLTDAQKEALNKVYSEESEVAGTRLTVSNLKDVVSTFLEQKDEYAIPYFKADTIINMPAMHTIDAQTMELTDLDVWDSWPVQNSETAEISNWNGYQLVVAMAGAPNKNSNHLYLLYNKYGDNDFSNWKNAGPIFGYNALQDEQQWSGSATVNSDGSIQLYYTKNDTTDYKLNSQSLASATLNLKIVNGEIKIDSVENDKTLFSGDGYHYQTYNQFMETFNQDSDGDGVADRQDNFTLRDPHIIVVDGARYLVFESNTGTENYQGDKQLYNLANYGKTVKDQVTQFLSVISNKDNKKAAYWANGSIGILKLDDNEKNPSVAEVYSPLITTSVVTDEVERPSIVPLNNKFYLFTASRISKSSDIEGTVSVRNAVFDDVVMLGFVSDSLRGEYTPLNNSSVVLTASVPASWRTSTYSYYAVPVKGYTDRVLITSYMTNRGEIAGKGNNSTWAPSFIVKINPDNTTTVLAQMTEQGDWIWDETSQSEKHVGNVSNARLEGETYYVNWDAIGTYGLRPHNPIVEPYTPTPNPTPTPEPNTPNTPNTPKTPDLPTPTPLRPSTPSNGGGKTVDTSENVLPNTGESDNSQVMMFTGLMSLLAATFYLGKHNKFNLLRKKY